MKNSNHIEIIKTSKILTSKDQNNGREVLRPLLNKQGIISMCLDSENLFIEYNPTIFSIEAIGILLEETGFSVNHYIKQAS